MNLRPIQTVIILLVFLLIGGPAAWFTTKGLEPSGPGDIGLDADGNLYAHYKERVFKFDSAGNSLGVFDLSSIGAKGLWGGLSFYPDGDWLIAPEGIEFDNKLHRCSTVGGLSCKPLAESTLQFYRTFRTSIDHQSRIYLSDSGRHTLSLHNHAGAQISAELSGLRHPGEVKLYGQILAVADVDNFQMKLLKLDSRDGSWSNELESFDTSATKASEVAINQPVDFIRHRDIWYVLVKDPTMSYARLRRYTLDGEYIDELPLPDTDMIMAIEKLEDSIVLSDFRMNRLLRIGFDGAPMPDLSSSQWREYRQELEGSGKTMLWIGVALWVLFGLMLVAGFVVALIMEKRKASATLSNSDLQNSVQPETAPPSQYDTSITWVGHSNGLKRLLIFMAITTLASTGFAFSQPDDCKFQPIAALMLLCSGIFLAFLYFGWRLWQRLSNTRLGVVNEWLVATLPDGTFVRSRATDLRLIRKVILVIEDRKIMMGTPQNRFFDKQGFEQHIVPQLQFAKDLGGAELRRWRWLPARKAQVVETFFAVVAIALFFAFYTGGEESIQRWLSGVEIACEERAESAGVASNEKKL